MIRLSAFADEISPDLEEQIAVLSLEHIHFLELRGVWNTNVLDLTDQQVAGIKETLDAHGIGVSAIGSPIGKVSIDSSFDEHLHRFERAIAVAHALQAPYIRIFSFFPPASQEEAGEGGTASPAEYRDEVLRRLREMTARARAAGVILLHENEKEIYGDSIARCVDLLQNGDETHLRAILDPANFIQCGQTPYPDAYEAVRPWLEYVHVKEGLAGPNCCSVCGWMAMMASSRSNLTSLWLHNIEVLADLICFAVPHKRCSTCYRRWVGSMSRG